MGGGAVAVGARRMTGTAAHITRTYTAVGGGGDPGSIFRSHCPNRCFPRRWMYVAPSWVM